MGDFYKQKATKMTATAPTPYGPKTIQDCIDRSMICEIPDRGISAEAAKICGIRTEFDTATRKPIAYYFPYTKKGKLTAFKRKDLTIPKGQQYHFTVIGTLDVSCDLFHQARCRKGGKKLFIVEGELDCASVVEAYLQMKGEKTFLPNVVSIGLGTKNAGAHLSSNLAFIDQFKMPVGCFDNDKATPEEARKGIEKGREAMGQAVLLIPTLYDLTFDEKDANDMLTEGKVEDLIVGLLYKAKLYEPDDIIFGSIGLKELLQPLKEGIYIEGMPGTMAMMHGFRPSELTLLLAASGVGKTTLSKWVGFNLVGAGAHVGHIFLEESIQKTQQSYIALACGVPLPDFRANPASVPLAMVQQAEKDYIDNGRTAWVTHHVGMNPKSVMRQLSILEAKGIKYVVFDHITQVFNQSASAKKTEQIDLLMEQLYTFVEATDMHVIVVSHVKRGEKRKPRGKDGSVIYPYWDELDMDMARGSGAFEQYAYNIICLEPERLEGGVRGRIRSVVRKNREWSTLGVGDILHTDPKTGRMIAQAAL